MEDTGINDKYNAIYVFKDAIVLLRFKRIQTGKAQRSIHMKVTVLMAHLCSSTGVSSTLEGLESANILHQINTRTAEPVFEFETASIDGIPVQCTGGLVLSPQKKLADIHQTDLIIVPGFLFQVLPLLPGFLAFAPWLKHHYLNSATIATMCTGTFIVAEAGLLDDKLATTHWYFANEFRKRYPKVNLSEQHIVTEDQNIICSGGASAGSDMLLHLIRKFISRELASECSKKLLVDTGRRDQTPYVMQSFNRNHEDKEIQIIQHWLEEHYMSHIIFDDISTKFGFGTRNFIRRFKEATQITPIQYLQNLRIEKAKYLLETTNKNVETITYDVGYQDINSFRRLFKERLHISPSTYRKKFQ
jgi:transcriptional regulator GlxA family with amidase domain